MPVCIFVSYNYQKECDLWTNSINRVQRVLKYLNFLHELCVSASVTVECVDEQAKLK